MRSSRFPFTDTCGHRDAEGLRACWGQRPRGPAQGRRPWRVAGSLGGNMSGDVGFQHRRGRNLHARDVQQCGHSSKEV